MRKYILLIALCLHGLARGQTQSFSYHYWFDNDISTAGKGSTTSDAWQMEVDLSGLSESFHTIHLQVTDEKNVSSAPVTRCFFLSREEGVLTDGFYWFDDEVKARKVEGGIQGTLTFDVTELPEGFHTLHYQVLRADGLYSQIETRSFYKLQSDQIVGQLTFMCYIDGTPFKQQRVSANNGVATWQLDVSDLPIGFHKLQVRAIMENGASTSIREAFFLRNAMDSELNALSCVFSLDGKPYKTVESGVNDGVFHCDLDVTALSDGLHKIAYMLTNGQGAQTTVKSQYFIKTPVGGNSIKTYQYWLNDNDNMAHTVVQDKVTDPLKLISLLPVEPQPLRSKLFQFEIKGGKPMMYAKNEIHLRFFDAAGRFTDASDQYVDYQVGQEVVPLGELQETQTFDRVAENDVRWYTMQVAPGDTVAFKLSQPATIQVFSPSGEEVFKTSESASVNWGGIHTWENGTYYLAVHDVTGSKEDMTLEYMHMDKYDVVDWDVHTVGNGGCSTITFKGNGFRDLHAVDLFTAEGDTIHSEHIDYESDASITVRFNFTDANVGGYDALFHFTEGEKEIRTCVSVEDAESIILVENVVYASSFLRGTANTYTIKIENKGNSTAYQVPLKIQLQADGGVSDITYIKLSDNLSSLEFEWLDDEAISESDREALKALIASKGNYLDFLMVRDTIENEDFMEGYFAVNLPPKTTTSFTLTVKSNSKVNVYTLLPNDWDFFAFDSQPSKLPRRIIRKSAKESMCCAKQHVECAMNLVATILDYGSVMGGGWAVASCIASVGNTVIPFAYDIWCGETPKDKDEAMKSLYKNIASSLISCVGKLDPYKMGWMIQHVNDVISTSISCFSHPKRIPNCPPKPPIPHPSNPRPPVDPNDIYGYLSEAGSKFIADSVAMVNYTIEFENDTMFATAAAHTIVIKDTLDSRHVDLTKFIPTGIRIGSREVFLDAADVMSKNNVTSFVKTIDMRPEINAIAQVEGKFNQKNGIALWTFHSLDPMTMEPTDDLMQGILPVNYDGTSGIGEVMFEVGVKQGKADGTQINNRASIVFDYEDAILTPTWTNIVDAMPPTSKVEYTSTEKADTVTLHFTGEDARSGIWRYTVYVQDGKNAPWREVGVTDSCAFDFEYAEGIDYGFCVLATDSAGNVEQKELVREAELRNFIAGDANSDGVVDTKDAVLVISYYLGLPGAYLNMSAADIVEDGVIDTKDAVTIIDRYLNTSTGPKAIKNRKRIRVL